MSTLNDHVDRQTVAGSHHGKRGRPEHSLPTSVVTVHTSAAAKQTASHEVAVIDRLCWSGLASD